jgi:hypothetical protein
VHAAQQNRLCSVPEPVDVSAGGNDTIGGATRDAMFVTQPGSTVATSLSADEAGDKKVALIKVS